MYSGAVAVAAAGDDHVFGVLHDIGRDRGCNALEIGLFEQIVEKGNDASQLAEHITCIFVFHIAVLLSGFDDDLAAADAVQIR